MEENINSTTLRIDKAAAEEYGVTTGEMHSKSRRMAVCMARCAAWLWLQRTLGWSTTRIGMSYGRNHSTVVTGLAGYRWSIANCAEQRGHWQAVKQTMAQTDGAGDD